MYHGETVMEIVTGKPVDAGGTVGRREATGHGVVHLVGRAMDRLGMRPQGTTAIIQGFGNVGSVTAQTLDQQGIKVIGVSDHTACYFDPKGLDVPALIRHTDAHGFLKGFSTEGLFDPAELMAQKCDILVPAAMERSIDGALAERLQCRILAEGANGPTTPEADLVLNRRRGEIFVIPDILCNAGGVVVSYFEWVQDLQQLFWTEPEVRDRLNRILERSFQQVMQRVERDKVPHRTAAMAIGVEKVQKAKKTRGLFP
jgi:glutamate dehydrogenase (NAD(P)+)